MHVLNDLEICSRKHPDIYEFGKNDSKHIILKHNSKDIKGNMFYVLLNVILDDMLLLFRNYGLRWAEQYS